MILASILHLFPFSDAYDFDKNTRNAAGWSFIACVLLQVLVNIALKGYLMYLAIKKDLPALIKWFKDLLF